MVVGWRPGRPVDAHLVCPHDARCHVMSCTQLDSCHADPCWRDTCLPVHCLWPRDMSSCALSVAACRMLGVLPPCDKAVQPGCLAFSFLLVAAAVKTHWTRGPRSACAAAMDTWSTQCVCCCYGCGRPLEPCRSSVPNSPTGLDVYRGLLACRAACMAGWLVLIDWQAGWLAVGTFNVCHDI